MDRYLHCELVSDDAKLPRRATATSAGLDLYSAEDVEVMPQSRLVVSTGLKVAIPAGHYGRVAPRSSLALKEVDVMAGVVDSDYRGIVGVVLFNNATEPFVVARGDRIAQLIVEKISILEPIQIVSLGDTARGQGGFGSTGK